MVIIQLVFMNGLFFSQSALFYEIYCAIVVTAAGFFNLRQNL